ncbi:MAG: MBL fold metallo-hydrolase [Deltaproteobacteria bacterium]|nr:MBL fold metallo-hydrolase [Deltaproteobacteria bacterium]
MSWIPIVFLALLASAGLVACCAFSSPRYTGPKTDHFDGVRFHNQVRGHEKGVSDMLKWASQRDPGEWHPRDSDPKPPPPRSVSEGIRITFINHSTVLLQLDGLNVLTDPIWSERASPVSFAGPKRVHAPGLQIEDLPPVDVILISHNHYDHLDVPTLRQLVGRHRPRIFTGLGNSVFLKRKKIHGSRDMDWWQSILLRPDVRLTFVPAQHFSSRGLCDHYATLWGGFVIEAPSGTVFFAGDTGLGPHFDQIRTRFGPPDLAILPIGAYKPNWFMSFFHLSPAEAIEAHRRLGARHSVGVHHSTFPLADDGQDDPALDLARAVEEAGLAKDAFWLLDFGQGRSIHKRPDLKCGPAGHRMAS